MTSTGNSTQDGTGSGTGDRSVWPGLTCDDAVAVQDWLRALGFTRGVSVTGATEGSVEHSEMCWPEGGRVMVHSRRGDDPFDKPVGAGNTYVVTRDPDAVHARAVAIGARFVRELDETDYGSRGFTVADAEGNLWSFGTYAGSDG